MTYSCHVFCLTFAGSLNTLRQSGTLYDIQHHEEDLLWSVNFHASVILFINSLCSAMKLILELKSAWCGNF